MDSIQELLRNKKTLITLLLTGILILAIPLGISLVKYQQRLSSQAAIPNIEVTEGDCVKLKNGVKVLTCGFVPLKLNFPTTPTPSPTNSPTPTPTSTATGSATVTPTATPVTQVIRVNGSDGNAIQAALNQVKTSGGAVYVPAGTYNVTDKVRVFSNVTLFGDGIDKTILQLDQSLLTNEGGILANDTNAGLTNVSVRDLTLKGLNQESGVTQCCVGIKLRDLDGGFFTNIKVEGFSWHGIWMVYKQPTTGNNDAVKNVRISNCQLLNNKGAGISIDSPSSQNVVDHCTISGNSSSPDDDKRNTGAVNLIKDEDGTVTKNKILANTITNNSFRGISNVARPGNLIEDNSFCNNTVQNNGDVDVADGNSENSVYIANKIGTNNGRVSTGGLRYYDQSTNEFFNAGGSDQIIDDPNPNATSPDCNIPSKLANIPPLPQKPSADTNFSNSVAALISTLAPPAKAQNPSPSPSHYPIINLRPPTLVSVTPQSCTGSGHPTFLLTWNQSPDAHGGTDNYIFRRTDNSTPAFPYKMWEIKSLNPSPWLDGSEEPSATVLKDKTKYCYFMSTVMADRSGQSQASNEICTTTPICGPITQCKDSQDNDGDGKIDEADPGCHTDGNANNPQSYDSDDNDEAEPVSPPPPSPPHGPQTQCNDQINNDFDGLIDIEDPDCHTDGNADNEDSYDPEIKFESRQYRLAESESELQFTLWSDYREDPLLTEFGLTDDSPGIKQIWVEFKETDGKTTKDKVTIELVEADPVIKSARCDFDSINKENLKVTIKGERFGTKESSVFMGLDLSEKDLDPKKKPFSNAEVLEWNDKEITLLRRSFKTFLLESVRFKMSVFRSDQSFSNIASCDIGASMISLGARVFCREPGKFDTENVKVTVFDKDSKTGKISKAEETVKIDKDGVITGLKTILQTGKNYALSIKAPNSLRRNATFMAEEGTTIVTRPNDQPFILPIGDIAPTQSPDGKINTNDKAVLTQQWRIFDSTESAKEKTLKTGDFNRDTKVNSFDWACMRYDFNASDDPIPTNIE